MRYLGVFIEAASSLSVHWIMPSGSSIVLLILFLGELVDWHQIQLLKSKCLPVLYYGMDACPLRKSQLKSLDFAVNSALRNVLPIFGAIKLCVYKRKCATEKYT